MARHPRRSAVALLALAALAAGGFWFARHRPGAGPPGPPPLHRDDPLAPAREALAVRKYAEAVQFLRRYLDLHPHYAEAQYLLAQTYRRTGDFDRWRRHLEQAKAADCPAPWVQQEQHLYRLQTGRVPGMSAVLENYLDSHPPEEVLILELLVQSYLDHNLLSDVVRLSGACIER